MAGETWCGWSFPTILRQTYDHLLLGTDHRYTMIMDLGGNFKTKPHRHRPCLVLEAWEFTCQVGIGQKMHTANLHFPFLGCWWYSDLRAPHSETNPKKSIGGGFDDWLISGWSFNFNRLCVCMFLLRDENTSAVLSYIIIYSWYGSSY